MSGRVSSVISKSGVVDNVWVAFGIASPSVSVKKLYFNFRFKHAIYARQRITEAASGKHWMLMPFDILLFVFRTFSAGLIVFGISNFNRLILKH